MTTTDSKGIAEFFHKKHLRLPDDPDSPLWNPDIDYEDVKAKIVEEKGWHMHDFGFFDDRSKMLWRKPYLDGATRELTAGDDRSVEEMRQM